MEVKERIAYVRGLMEGSATHQDPATRALWDNLLQVCDGLADSVQALSSAQSEFEQYVEAIDDDLCELQEEFYGLQTTEVEDDTAEYTDDGEVESEDDHVVRAECPRCGEEAFFDEAYLYDDKVEISCPECGEILYRGGEPPGDFDNNEHPDDDTLYASTDPADYGSAPYTLDN